jgi:hypothetical protein
MRGTHLSVRLADIVQTTPSEDTVRSEVGEGRCREVGVEIWDRSDRSVEMEDCFIHFGLHRYAWTTYTSVTFPA